MAAVVAGQEAPIHTALNADSGFHATVKPPPSNTYTTKAIANGTQSRWGSEPQASRTRQLTAVREMSLEGPSTA